MKTSINTIFSPNFVLYWKDYHISSSRFEIIKLGKIVDLYEFQKFILRSDKVYSKNAVKTTKSKKP